jgi:hypothetical protein
VARIRLYIEQSLRTEEGVVYDQGAEVRVPFLRVFVNLRIGEQARYTRDAIVDIGAPLTVFPREQWQKFKDDIEWLTAPPSAPSWLRSIAGRTGGSQACLVGRVSVVAFDLGSPPTFLPALKVLALFEREYSPDDRILIGLHASILQGRRLSADPDRREAWLEDR